MHTSVATLSLLALVIVACGSDDSAIAPPTTLAAFDSSTDIGHGELSELLIQDINYRLRRAQQRRELCSTYFYEDTPERQSKETVASCAIESVREMSDAAQRVAKCEIAFYQDKVRCLSSIDVCARRTPEEELNDICVDAFDAYEHCRDGIYGVEPDEPLPPAEDTGLKRLTAYEANYVLHGDGAFDPALLSHPRIEFEATRYAIQSSCIFQTETGTP